jgi:hypothetical protein
MKKQIDQKNLILFFPWDTQLISVFSKIRKNQLISSEDTSLIHRYSSMVKHILLDMKFEYLWDSNDEKIVLTDYLTDSDWKLFQNTFKISLKMNSVPNEGNVRGWIIDLKNLHFYQINEYSLNFFKEKIKIIKSFDDLEKFLEDFKFRFAAKKFGI